jgi:hypothetical protein
MDNVQQDFHFNNTPSSQTLRIYLLICYELHKAHLFKGLKKKLDFISCAALKTCATQVTGFKNLSQDMFLR